MTGDKQGCVGFCSKAGPSRTTTAGQGCGRGNKWHVSSPGGFGQGDSAGHFACPRTSGTWTLSSVVSRGVCCDRGWDTLNRSTPAWESPSIFSRVAAFVDFVAQHMTPGRCEHWEVLFLSCLFSTVGIQIALLLLPPSLPPTAVSFNFQLLHHEQSILSYNLGWQNQRFKQISPPPEALL